MQIALSIFTFRLTGSIPRGFCAPRGHFAVLRGALWRLFGGSEIASKAIFYCFCSEISIIFLSLWQLCRHPGKNHGFLHSSRVIFGPFWPPKLLSQFFWCSLRSLLRANLRPFFLPFWRRSGKMPIGFFFCISKLLVQLLGVFSAAFKKACKLQGKWPSRDSSGQTFSASDAAWMRFWPTCVRSQALQGLSQAAFWTTFITILHAFWV